MNRRISPAFSEPWIQPTDLLFLFYQALICLIVTFGTPSGPKALYWVAHLAFTAAIVLFLRFAARSSHPVVRFVRANYPLMVITFFYMEAGRLVHAIFPWTLDPWLWKMDNHLFGGGPALWAAQQARVPPLAVTEFFHIGYSFFYFLMPLAAITLYFRGTVKKHRTFMFTLLLTYFTHYLLFILLPAHSPRLYDPALMEPLPGYLWSDWLKMALRDVAYPGGSFPSSHVAASVICFMAWKAFGKCQFPVLFMTLVMFAGTVYGRYHYVTDILTGLAVGLLLYWLGPRIERGISDVARQGAFYGRENQGHDRG